MTTKQHEAMRECIEAACDGLAMLAILPAFCNFLFVICFLLGKGHKMPLMPAVIVLCFALFIVSVVISWLKLRKRIFSSNTKKQEQETQVQAPASFEDAPNASEEESYASHQYQKLENVNVLYDLESVNVQYAGKPDMAYGEI